jgi:CubicO group peptidase (beta-lactamase class C family)
MNDEVEAAEPHEGRPQQAQPGVDHPDDDTRHPKPNANADAAEEVASDAASKAATVGSDAASDVERAAVEAARPLVERAVADEVTPGAVLLVGTAGGAGHGIALGMRRYGGAAVTLDTRYDLASLTKVVGCLPALLHLLDKGEIRLNDPLRRFFSNAGWFQEPSLGDATLEQLALHVSGLPAWKPLFAWVSDRRTAIANVLQTERSENPGTQVYSDLGVIALTAVIERVSGLHLDVFLHRHVFGPMEMPTTRYGPLPHGVPVAATEDDGWRGRMLEGEVHDENAVVLDGVSGHAGLFATAADLLRYGRAWLLRDAPFASSRWLDEALRDRSGGVGSRRGLLWSLRHDGWAFGKEASGEAFGHTGFTGTSLAIDPGAGWVSVLLTNRVHPHRGSPDGIIRLRRSVHDAITVAFREAST